MFPYGCDSYAVNSHSTIHFPGLRVGGMCDFASEHSAVKSHGTCERIGDCSHSFFGDSPPLILSIIDSVTWIRHAMYPRRPRRVASGTDTPAFGRLTGCFRTFWVWSQQVATLPLGGLSPLGSRLGIVPVEVHDASVREGRAPARPDGGVGVRTPRAEGGAGTLRAGPTLAWDHVGSGASCFGGALFCGGPDAQERVPPSHHSFPDVIPSQTSCRRRGYRRHLKPRSGDLTT